MQIQSISSSSRPLSNFYGGANCKLSNAFLSKKRVSVVVKKGRFEALCMRTRDRQDLQIVRAKSESTMEESETSGMESSASGLIAEDLEAGEDESLREQHFSSVGIAAYPRAYSFRDLTFAEHHLLLLGFIGFVMTGALSCVFLAAIPTLLAMKRAAESVEKLADTAREELPGTMAAIRLSGMEISDLTMELSELGEEISSGVRNSSRALRAAGDGLRRIGHLTVVAEGEKGNNMSN